MDRRSFLGSVAAVAGAAVVPWGGSAREVVALSQDSIPLDLGGTGGTSVSWRHLCLWDDAGPVAVIDSAGLPASLSDGDVATITLGEDGVFTIS